MYYRVDIFIIYSIFIKENVSSQIKKKNKILKKKSYKKYYIKKMIVFMLYYVIYECFLLMDFVLNFIPKGFINWRNSKMYYKRI